MAERKPTKKLRKSKKLVETKPLAYQAYISPVGAKQGHIKGE
jgi:hypothetical protein